MKSLYSIHRSSLYTNTSDERLNIDSYRKPTCTGVGLYYVPNCSSEKLFKHPTWNALKKLFERIIKKQTQTLLLEQPVVRNSSTYNRSVPSQAVQKKKTLMQRAWLHCITAYGYQMQSLITLKHLSHIGEIHISCLHPGDNSLLHISVCCKPLANHILLKMSKEIETTGCMVDIRGVLSYNLPNHNAITTHTTGWQYEAWCYCSFCAATWAFCNKLLATVLQ
jgi:hypothetical protein